MSDTIDLLQIKIEKAKRQLSDDTLNAINAIPWQAEILKMKETRGYSFDQLGDLEIETELLLCGLVSPLDYPKELEKRMKISTAQANELVREMNKEVFEKIKEELIKNTERKEVFEKKQTVIEKPKAQSLKYASKIAPVANKLVDLTIPELKAGNEQEESIVTPVKPHLGEQNEAEIHPMLAKKMSDSFQIPSVKTDHSLNNLSPNNTPTTDPYREVPE